MKKTGIQLLQNRDVYSHLQDRLRPPPHFYFAANQGFDALSFAVFQSNFS